MNVPNNGLVELGGGVIPIGLDSDPLDSQLIKLADDILAVICKRLSPRIVYSTQNQAQIEAVDREGVVLENQHEEGNQYA